MNIEPFIIDDYRAIAGEENLSAAIVNAISGPAFTLSDGGQILAIGGVRVQGIGQAWAMLAPGAEHRAKTIIKTARAVIEESMRQEKLYRLYAEATVDKPAWFKHLGFHQQNNIYVR